MSGHKILGLPFTTISSVYITDLKATTSHSSHGSGHSDRAVAHCSGPGKPIGEGIRASTSGSLLKFNLSRHQCPSRIFVTETES
jgi:hypothetical protein